jgi:hypothetical protein
MIPQYSEDMPFLKIDEEREKVWIERDGGDVLANFYETCSDDWESPVSERYAKGLYTFVKNIENNRFPFLKGHVTGPLTFTLGLRDEKGKCVYYDEELREISLLLLKAKIRWQIKMLSPFADQVVIFIDEPILSALGSTAYIGVDAAEALRLLKEAVESVKLAGGIPGIHCCGKADWPLVINSGADIISFDAYGYVETITLYPAEFSGFLKKGGYLALGIVPTTEVIKSENIGPIQKRLNNSLNQLSDSLPRDLLLSQILLTPSCGTGSRSIEETTKIFKILTELKQQ